MRLNLDPDEIIELLEDIIGRLYGCAEDDILDSIYNGNWTAAAREMVAQHIEPSRLIDYIEDYRFEVDPDAYDWFSLESAVAITELYHQERYVALAA